MTGAARVRSPQPTPGIARISERAAPDALVGRRLRTLRVKALLTGRALDDLAGCASGQTSNIEKGRRVNMEVRPIAALADVLGCTLDWLLRGVGASPGTDQVRAAVASAAHSQPHLWPRLPEYARGSSR